MIADGARIVLRWGRMAADRAKGEWGNAMSEISMAVRDTSRIGTVLGIATIVCGILAMAMPMVSGLAVAGVVAVLLIAAGIARTLFAFKAPSFGKGLLVFLFGGISILCGVVMLARPLLGLPH